MCKKQYIFNMAIFLAHIVYPQGDQHSFPLCPKIHCWKEYMVPHSLFLNHFHLKKSQTYPLLTYHKLVLNSKTKWDQLHILYRISISVWKLLSQCTCLRIKRNVRTLCLLRSVLNIYIINLKDSLRKAPRVLRNQVLYQEWPEEAVAGPFPLFFSISFSRLLFLFLKKSLPFVAPSLIPSPKRSQLFGELKIFSLFSRKHVVTGG